ncbi:NUDIX hydrolase [Deinococcus sp. S9]|uniref:NUDIX hydrolase n=1 Tax=Deinococcus sp. S9 TaxID=2545754 RepID=UPI0010560A7D|nr:NUDIX hydrolase [Deinococcus sp. S9]TDE86698.1 NUDIX hydrolase [Deinococcus sp. S9]
MAVPAVSGLPSAAPIPGAGGVVLDGAGRVLLVRYRSGAWAFPKGHLEAGETPEQTAVREVREETGVSAVPLAPLPATRYTNDRGEAREIYWFVMRTPAVSTTLEETFVEGGFFTPDVAATMLTYPEDQHLLRAALALTSGGTAR